jgi:ABC-type multidrug transport system permease subunit
MKTLYRILFLILFYSVSFAQSSDCGEKYDSLFQRNLYTWVDSMPEYPGGMRDFVTFLAKNTTYPQDLIAFPSTFLLVFVVEIDGTVQHIKILNTHKKEQTFHWANTQVEKLNQMKTWKSGSCFGKLVPVLMTVPIRFCLK